jgi:hypothetical protein
MLRRDFLLSTASAVAFRSQPESRWLVEQQAADGGWHSRTYGLLRSGQSLTGFVLASIPKHEAAALERGQAFLAAHTDREGGVGLANPAMPDYPNYATALAVRARPKAAKSVEYLLSRQFTEADEWRETDPAFGAWGMGGDRRMPPDAGHVDLSMTRHVLEALASAGVRPEHPAMQRARVFLERCQNEDGGFHFSTVVMDANKAGGTRSYGSATADGIIALTAAGSGAARIDAAEAWLLKHHRPDAAPGFHGEAYARWPRGLRYYYAAASAEAFRLLGVPRDIDQDRRLRAERRRDGSWANPEPLVKEDDPLIATGFALQALR